MKSKEVGRKLKSIEKEIKGHLVGRVFDRGIDAIVPDTSSLIDIVKYTKDYIGNNKDYLNPMAFFDKLTDRKTVVLIPEAIVPEIDEHSRIKLNGFKFEITKEFKEYLDMQSRFTNGFLTGVRYKADSEQVRYDVHWTTKNACLNNPKKHDEGYSDTDKGILAFVSLIQGARMTNGKDYLNDIHVLAADEHILKGIEFLKNEYGYRNINPIDTRIR